MQDINLAHVALQYFCLLFSLCVHEAAHAAMADRCGDSTARFLGRITLDPRKHADPLGTVVLPLLGIITQFPYLFGWAKPVPFNPLNLRDRKKGPVWIALAGPASNVVLAVFSALIMRLILIGASSGVLDINMAGALMQVFGFLTIINLVLVLFNMIPIPPLDGHYVLKYFLPPRAEEIFERIGPFGLIIVIFAGSTWVNFAMNYCEEVIEVISGVPM